MGKGQKLKSLGSKLLIKSVKLRGNSDIPLKFFKKVLSLSTWLLVVVGF